MQLILTEIFFVFILLLANGVFAMAEIAVVSSRKSKLRHQATTGDLKAKVALDLAESPGRFLSTVQVGITLVGVLAGAVGGATLAEHLSDWLKQFPLLTNSAELIAMVIVVGIITYFSVVIGELVPKRIALNNPERIAAALASPMRRLSVLADPLVSLLNNSSDKLLQLMGLRKSDDLAVSEEEVRGLMDAGMTAGVFKKSEKEMMEGVLDLDELTVRDLMTPKASIISLDVREKEELNWGLIAKSGHSHFPVYDGQRDNVLGLVSVKSLWANLSLVGKTDLKSLVTPPLYVPFSMPAMKLIEAFKTSGKHVSLVVDEFGGILGLVTLNDVMEAIVGDLPERERRQQPRAVKREDGTWVVDALLDLDSFQKTLALPEGMEWEESEVQTVGGWVLKLLGRIPLEGEKVTWQGLVFEIIDMDRQRIDKLLVHKSPN